MLNKVELFGVLYLIFHVPLLQVPFTELSDYRSQEEERGKI